MVTRQSGVAASLLFQWRKLERQGALTAVSAGEAVVPASELAATRAEIAKLQRVLGRKPWRTRSSKRPWSTPPKKVDCALTLVAQGRWPIKAICEALGLARSHIHALRQRPASWADGRKARTSASDGQLLIELREHIVQLPSYGYRRACALVNRARQARAQPRVNPKRVPRDGSPRTAAAACTPPSPIQSAPQRHGGGTG